MDFFDPRLDEYPLREPDEREVEVLGMKSLFKINQITNMRLVAVSIPFYHPGDVKRSS